MKRKSEISEKIERAFAQHFANTGIRAEKEFMEKEWPDSTELGKKQNFRNLKSGKFKMSVDTLINLCSITNTDPNTFLEWGK